MSEDVRLTPPPKRAPIDALTGLRFLAASWVVLYHYAGAALPSGTPAGLRNAVGHGYVGVNFFYLLSGFILAYNYAEGAPGAVRMRGTKRAFWKNRLSRIYPMYLAAWLLAAPFVVAHRFATDASSFVALAKLGVAALVSLGLVQAWLPGANAWWNPPGWSISVEAFFYAVFPWVLPRIAASRRSRVVLGLAAWGGSLVVPALYVARGGGELALAAVKYEPLLHLPTFLLGILLAEVFDSKHKPLLARCRVPLGIAALLAVVVCVRVPAGFAYPLIHNGLLSPAFGGILLAVALGIPLLSPLLASRGAVLLGEASYALYILQAPLWLTWRKVALGLTPGIDFAVFFVMLCLASVGAHRFIEVPAQRWLRRRELHLVE